MEEGYVKDFEGWIVQKQHLNARLIPDDFFILEGEVWWVSLGTNISHEIDGKNNSYERPALILKKFNEELVWIIPITSKMRRRIYYCPILFPDDSQGMLDIPQMRSVSINRMLRPVFRMKEDDFVVIKCRICGIISSITKIPPL